MISGVLYALLAGLMWGLIFVGPLIVPEYPAVLQSMGRYLALGLIALPLAWLGRVRLRQLSAKDWLTALALTMMGNLIYYVCLASAIQRTGAPVSTMIIGTLPVVIPVFANLLYSQRDGRLSWLRLAPALLLIGIGLLCVNIAELNQGLPDFSGWRYGSGIALALAAGEPGKTPDDVGDGAGAGNPARFAAGLPRRLLLAAWENARLRPAVRPAPCGVCRPNGGDCGAVLMGRRAVLEHCQPAITDGDPRPIDRVRNAGGFALHLHLAPDPSPCADAQRYRFAGYRRGGGSQSKTGKTTRHSAFRARPLIRPPLERVIAFD